MTRSRWILAAVACAFAGNIAHADYNPATLPRVPSIAAVTGGHLSQYKQFYLSAYYAGLAGGQGSFSQVGSCSDDGGRCIHDADGIAFTRDNFGDNGIVDAKQYGVWLDGQNFAAGTAHDDSTRANAVLAAASAAGIATVVFPGVLNQASADLEVPSNVAVDFGADPIGKRANNDYRASTILGGILLSAGHKIHLNCSSAVQNGTALQATGTYAPAIFKPITIRDKQNVQASFTGAAILADCNDALVQNFSLFGFGSMDGTVPAVEMVGAGMHLKHVIGDCMACIYQHGSGGGGSFDDVELQSYLTRGSGNLVWKVDSIADDGAGHYKVLAEAPPVDDASDVIWHNGDHLYVVRDAGVQSAVGQHTISNVTTVAGGACLIAQCQQATLDGTHSAATAVTATWAAALRADGNFPVTINSVTTGGHTIDDLAVGQTFADGSCLTGGVIKDIWTTKNLIWLDPALLTVTCSGSAAAATATDTGYVHNGALALKMSSAQRRATAMNFLNVGGTKVSNSQLYTHDYEVHCGDQAESLRFSAVNTGEDSGNEDEGNIALLMDGNHTGKDCGGLTWTGGVLGQHVTVAVKVQSDNRRPAILTAVGLSPGSARINGVGLELDSGAVTLEGDHSLTPANVLVGDSQEYRTVYLDDANVGSSYLNGETVTTTGGTCSQQAQAVLTVVGGVVTAATQSRPFICTVYPTNPISTTGGSGTGVKLDTDGVIPGVLLSTGSHFGDSEFYQQTFPNPNFQGAANVCADMSDCNSDQGINSASAVIGSPTGGNKGPGSLNAESVYANGANLIGSGRVGVINAGPTLALANSDCGKRVVLGGTGQATYATLPASPDPNCGFTFEVEGSGGWIDPNSNNMQWPGNAGVTSDVEAVSYGTEYAYIELIWDTNKWIPRAFTPILYENSTPLITPRLRHGEVKLGYNAASTYFELCPYNGHGGILINDRIHIVLPDCWRAATADTTSSLTNYAYAKRQLAVTISGVADNGSGKARLTFNNAVTAGSRFGVMITGVKGAYYVNGIHTADYVDATHADLVDVNYDGAKPYTALGSVRVDRIIFSTTGHKVGPFGTEVKSDDASVTYLGPVGVGTSNAILGYGNQFNREGEFYGGYSTIATATGTGEQTLNTVDLQAGTLDYVGRKFRIHACFKKAANGDTVTPLIYFGSVSFGTSTTGSGAISCLDMDVVKTGASTQNVAASGSHGTLAIAPAITAATENDAATIVVKATATDGTSAAADETLVEFYVRALN